MKKIFLGSLVLLMLAGSIWAMGPFMPTILSSSKVVQLKGKVTQTNRNGYGCMKGCGSLTLKTDSGNVVVFGFGPYWFWNRQNINTPANGDEITVKAYNVNVNGQNYYVAKEVQFANGKTVQIRNNSGYPDWMQYMNNHGMMGKEMHNNNMNNNGMMMCPGMQNQMNHQ